MELNKPFSLPARRSFQGRNFSAAEDENHRMWSLQLGELPAFRGVIGKLGVVGEDRTWNVIVSCACENLQSWIRAASSCSMIGGRRSQNNLSRYVAPKTFNMKNRQRLGRMQRSHLRGRVQCEMSAPSTMCTSAFGTSRR